MLPVIELFKATWTPRIRLIHGLRLPMPSRTAIANRFWQLPRRNLGLANYLGGTGMCFESKLLKEMGWGATSLVEDLEFSMRCVKRGIHPDFNYEANVYDEKPLTFKASASQRLRWMQGHFDVAALFLPAACGKVSKRAAWTKIDAALYSVSVYNSFLGHFFTALLWIR